MSQFIVSVEIKAPELVEAICLLASAIGVDKSRTAAPTLGIPTSQLTTAMEVQAFPQVQTLMQIHTAQHTPAPETISAPASVPAVTSDQVREKLSAIVNSGKVSEVQQLIAQFGGTILSDITPDKYSALLQAAEVLTAPVAQTSVIQSAPAVVPTTTQTYTMEQLAAAATQLVDAGRRDEITGLLASFGVQALTALPKERYGEFATQLRALGARI